MDTQVVIHFVGLCVFTTRMIGINPTNPTDRTARISKQVVAIMPEVPRHIGGSIWEKKASSPPGSESNAAAQTVLSDVEPHAALIIFESWARIGDARGWTVQHLSDDPANAYDYIELNHDQVSFIVDRPNEVARMPSGLGHIGGTGTLKADYSPPSYTGAAAVFNIPRGKITMCVSNAVGVNGRRDTELRLTNSGAVTIKSGTKSLTLDSNAVIYAVNVPMSYAVSHGLQDSSEHLSANHFLVYCRMTGTADNNCQLPRIDEGDNCTRPALNAQDPCHYCSENAERRRKRPSRSAARSLLGGPPPSAQLGPPPIVNIASFECSNTQYP